MIAAESYHPFFMRLPQVCVYIVYRTPSRDSFGHPSSVGKEKSREDIGIHFFFHIRLKKSDLWAVKNTTNFVSNDMELFVGVSGLSRLVLL